MRCFSSILGALPIALLVSACTSIAVKPVSSSDAKNMRHVCIKNNPLVKVTDFIPVLEQGLARHQISSEVYAGLPPEHCQYTLQYTALRSWDITPYLSQAEISLHEGQRQIAKANYHLRGKGGLSLSKWDSTQSKIDPVIDQLLAGQ